MRIEEKEIVTLKQEFATYCADDISLNQFGKGRALGEKTFTLAFYYYVTQYN